MGMDGGGTMRLIRIIGLAVALVAAGLGTRDLWAWQQAEPPPPIRPGVFDPLGSGSVPLTLGELWVMAAPQTPNTVQAVVQRRLHPALWDDVILPVLLAPAWAVALGLGAALSLLGRLGRRRRRR